MDLDKKQNKLIIGDNLEALKYIAKESVDLVYIDPPYATGLDFYISDSRSNSISSSSEARIAYSDKFTLKTYLGFLKPRLELLHNVLSKQGSLYVHIDSSRVHHVKVLLDEIFGIENFRADITRIKCNPKNFKRANYGNIKDHILFYTKTDKYIWNDVTEKVNDDDLNKRFNKKDLDGRNYTTVPIHAPGETKNGATGEQFLGQSPPVGRHWRYNTDKLLELYNQGLIEVSKTGNMRLKVFKEDKLTKKIQDVWSFKDPQNPLYPTQKNSDMIERIIANSSNENSTVLDCFCGSGTTLFSAQKLGRTWIGIDQSEEAIQVVRKRLSLNPLFKDYIIQTEKDFTTCLNF